MDKFQIIALTPLGLFDPAIAIAASRAGGIGILDLEFAKKVADVEEAVHQLKQYAGERYGLRLDVEQAELISEAASWVPKHTGYVVLTGDGSAGLIDCVKAFRREGISVLWESLGVQDARYGMEAGVDGLIAKGNEAAGRVGHDTAFILLQRLIKETGVLPVWVQGGIGPHTAAGCYAGGAAGVVLDSQLLLTRESSIPGSAKAVIAGMDGSETLCLGEELGAPCRLFAQLGSPTLEHLRASLLDLGEDESATETQIKSWRRMFGSEITWHGREGLWPIGPDVASAKRLSDRFKTVGGILGEIRRCVDENITSADRHKPFAEGSPLAQCHGTRYPIVQGPMARVSDRSAFALGVAKGGALPFVAVGYMDPVSLERLLEETRDVLGDLPWGVGILGFLPSEQRQRQLEVIHRFSPPFAVLAGGRPDQILPLEREGIQTYVHVPSPGLLDMFLEAGARRFIFEGRECGGHVGPRSSFLLWESMVDTLLRRVPEKTLSQCHILFAGGIHDEISSAIAAAIGAPLVQKGARLGLLMGTAYLFTKEAVSTGAIVEGFQQEALNCTETAELESSPGHAVRCTISPYAHQYKNEKKRLTVENRSPDEIRRILEEMNRGRLRIASKGVKRGGERTSKKGENDLVAVDQNEQRSEGLYMIGQLATLWDKTCTMEELHGAVSVEGSRRLTELVKERLPVTSSRFKERPSDVAIIGMACLMPKAADLQRYWENIINKVNGVTEVPGDRWSWHRYFEPNSREQDKFYSKWGGFLDPVPFDPMRYGMPPNSLKSVEPLQLLTLETVRVALADAGYADRPFPRERTSVIVGASGGLADLGQSYAFRAALPLFFDDVPEEILAQLPEWTEDSFAGTLTNVAAGRVANRLDLGGVNYSINAACASSLAAVYAAVRELESGTSDMVLVAGSDTFQNPHFFFCFSKTHALSPTGRGRTVDKDADGTCISEGIAVVALKRLADAERDGDRIYCVIKGVGGSSDGRHKGLTAPHPEGQARALNRAYDKSGISPASVGLIEAHGTGTVAGDRSEIETLKQVFESAEAGQGGCALGSVKSVTGHTKSAAGVAGLIKIALALHHKVLPPTIGVDNPNPSLIGSPFYVNTEPRPWIHGTEEHPRRAGVSSFGFGGTNFHAVAEEYTGNFLASSREAVCIHWPSELFLFAGDSGESLFGLLGKVRKGLVDGAKPRMVDLAHALWKEGPQEPESRLAIVADGLDDLLQKVTTAENALKQDGNLSEEVRDIYYSKNPLAQTGKIAFLFPGQGSQHPGMLQELVIHFPEVRDAFSLADQALQNRFDKCLTDYIFPPPCFSREEERRYQKEITQTHVAQPALSAAAMGIYRLLEAFEIHSESVAGHSSGEYAALCAAGVFDEQDLYRLTEARGRFITEMSGDDSGTMAAVKEGRENIEEVLKGIEGVWIANLNAPKQTIISGNSEGMTKAVKRLEQKGMKVRSIPVSCAFHSPMVAPARDRLADFIQTVSFREPQVAVYSNTTGQPYPEGPEEMARLLGKHLTHPVNFIDEIERMYDAGGRIFVEAGPRNVLTGLVRRIIGDRPHLAVSADRRDRSGLLQLNHLLGQLAGHGVRLNLTRLYEGRVQDPSNLDALLDKTKGEHFSPTTWMITGGKVWPYGKEMPGCPQPVVMTGRGKPATVGKPDDLGQTQVMGRDQQVDTAGMEQVMLQHQRLMEQFLETQKEVMKSYLGQGEDPAGGERRVESVPQADFHRPERRNEYGKDAVETAEKVLDAESDRDIRIDETTEKGGADGRDEGIDPDGLTRRLVEIVSERTGYPEDMIDLDSSLDADLGIDSIKWVEILGTLQQSYLNLDESRIQSAMEELSEIGTLRGVIDWFAGSGFSGNPPETVRPDTETDAEMPGSPSGTSTDRKALTDQLVGIVSERTGYPPDMIDLDLSLDADLGIDSIKWVEILGTLQQSYLQLDESGVQSAMEELSEARSLREVIDWFEGADLSGEGPAKTPNGPPAEGPECRKCVPASPCHEEGTLPRYVLSVKDKPREGKELILERGSVFVITDDERGLAQELAEQLDGKGAHTVILRNGKKVKRKRRCVYTADLASLEQVMSVASLIRKKEGPVTGIVHLMPLAVGGQFENMTSDERANRLVEVKGLFLLAKGFGNQLKQAGAAGQAWVLAATGMGGTFGIDGHMPRTVFPGQGGVCGVVKTLSTEWPQVRCKVVDVDPTDSIRLLAENIFSEITCRDEQIEVGVTRDRRTVPFLKAVSSEPEKGELSCIDANSVILSTGGARGITGQVMLELARRYHPTLLLVGLSPFPDEESAETANVTAVDELKRIFIDRYVEAKGEKPTPRQVDDDLRTLQKRREIRRNIQAMEKAGAKVRYYSVDVRDETVFGGLIEEIYREFGRLDGVIHGAGVIEDKLVEDKTVDSFERVLQTKVDSAFVLTQKLQVEALKFLIFFASIAGRFGNKGQGDYAAANEILNKLASYFDRKWSSRVVAVNWNPWADVGMAGPEALKQFEERGIIPIKPSAGGYMLAREINCGRKGETQIVIGEGPWGNGGLPTGKGSGLGFPMLEGASVSTNEDRSVELVFTLDPRQDPYLQDHRIDGRPVFPFAMAMELMSELVQCEWPGWVVSGLHSAKRFRGIVLDSQPKQIRVSARQAEPDLGGQDRREVNVEILDNNPPGSAVYTAVVELVRKLPGPSRYEGTLLSPLQSFPLSIEEAYERWLFHGPCFQGISKVEGYDEKGLSAQLMPSTPATCLSRDTRGSWVIDPVVIDSAFQLSILWERAHYDMTFLISSVGSYKRFGPFSGAPVRCLAEMTATVGGHLLSTNFYFLDDNENVVALIENMEGSCSKELNRIVGNKK